MTIIYHKPETIDNINEDEVYQKLNERKFLNIFKPLNPQELYTLKTYLTSAYKFRTYTIKDLDISYLIILNMLSLLGHTECDNWNNIVTYKLDDIKECLNFDSRLLVPSKTFKIPKNLKPIYFAQMSAFKFYNFWYNFATKHKDSFEELFLYYTKLSIEEINQILINSLRVKRIVTTFANTITEYYFGKDEVNLIIKARDIINGNDMKIREISLDLLELFKEELLIYSFNKIPIHAYRLLLDSRLKKSIGEGRKVIRQSKLYLNGIPIKDQNYIIQKEDLIDNKYLFIRIKDDKFVLVKYIGY